MLDGIGHVMGDHEGGQIMLGDDLIREIENLGGSGRIESGGVLVKQQQLRLLKGGHQQRDGLALTAGEQTDSCGHPVFQTEAEGLEAFAVFRALFFGHAPAETALLSAALCEGKIFLQLHIGGGAHHRVLKHTADQEGSLMLGQGGNVVPVEDDPPVIDGPDAGDGVEHGGFACTVSADDGDKITGIQMEGELVEGTLFVDGAGVEGLADLEQVKHGSSPPSV